MFEFTMALRYLLPRKRQISVALISCMSVLVISLVVWLVLIFLSVTEGIEKKWLHKLTSLHAPLRITPTEAYYSSYYYQIDSISAASHFHSKTIAEKWNAPTSDPYNPLEDEELPLRFPLPDIDPISSQIKDPVKRLYEILGSMNHSSPDLAFQDFEMGGALLRLQLVRPSSLNHPGKGQTFLTQASYVSSFPDQSQYAHSLLLPTRPQDLNHLYFLAPQALEHCREDSPTLFTPLPSQKMHSRFQTLAQAATLHCFKTANSPWFLPQSLLPQEGRFRVQTLFQGNEISHIQISPDPLSPTNGQLIIHKGELTFIDSQGNSAFVDSHIPLLISDPLILQGSLVEDSVIEAKRLEDLRLCVNTSLQGQILSGEIPWDQIEIEKADITTQTSGDFPLPWVTRNGEGKAVLPINEEQEAGILLAKNFQDQGVFIGDRGYLSYSTATASGVQEQRLPIFVAGFYDPGVLAVGAKCILAPHAIAHTIHCSSSSFYLDKMQANGVLVWFKDLQAVEEYQKTLQQALCDAGIDRYWKISSFKEYDFAKDLLQQFQSDQTLFTMVGVIILIVACCNIISLLVLLVNDKKKEIGILQAMGASRYSIAAIFGACGAVMGILSSALGTLAAFFTLKNLHLVVHFLSFIQGHDAFNAQFFGPELPNQLSTHALLFICMTTPLLALFAGLIPALKACRLKPSEILRAE